MSAYLRGLGAFSPPHRYSNAELCDLFDVPRDRGERYGHMLGVQNRASVCDYRNGRVQTITGDEMAYQAACIALDDAGIAADAIDVVISTSSFFDYIAPPPSALVMRKLGLQTAQTFDLIGGCAEFLHGVHLARLLVDSGQARNVLVTSSEVITAWWAQIRYPLEYFIFGDSGGAVVVSADGGSHRIVESLMRTDATIDGVPADLIIMPIIGGKTPAPLADASDKVDPVCAAQSDVPAAFRLIHNARQIGLAAPRAMLRAASEVIERCAIDPADAFLVPHQASRNVLEAMTGTRIPKHQIGISLTHRGNLSTSSIPVTWSDHREQADACRYVLASSVGVGMSYGAILFERVA